MKLERHNRPDASEYYTVLVEKDELVVKSGKTVSYSTWIGTVSRKRINLWYPTSHIPRGYGKAAMTLLKEAQKQISAKEAANDGG